MIRIKKFTLTRQDLGKSIAELIVATIGIYLVWRPSPKAIINGREFRVEVAVSAEEKSRGLGYRESLGEDSGMVFVFNQAERYPFWMKGMRFPIDILWIRDNTIVEVTKNVQPVSNPEEVNSLPIYHPQEKVNRVLELNARTSDKYGIKAGNTIKFKL